MTKLKTNKFFIKGSRTTIRNKKNKDLNWNTTNKKDKLVLFFLGGGGRKEEGKKKINNHQRQTVTPPSTCVVSIGRERQHSYLFLRFKSAFEKIWKFFIFLLTLN